MCFLSKFLHDINEVHAKCVLGILFVFDFYAEVKYFNKGNVFFLPIKKVKFYSIFDLETSINSNYRWPNLSNYLLSDQVMSQHSIGLNNNQYKN